MTFDEWWPYKKKMQLRLDDDPCVLREYAAGRAAWHAAQEAMKERAARACEGYEVGEETPPKDGDGPDCWDWHSKDYAATVRALQVE
jgi:hypothetical protein